VKRCIFCMLLLSGIVSLAGCASTPAITTRSYALVNPETETALIKSIVIEDEIARIGTDKYQAIVREAGGTFRPFEGTDENTVIVRTTSHGHSAIRKALDESRRDIEATRDNHAQPLK